MFIEAVDLYRPPVSPWLIGALIGAAAVGAVVLYVRRARHDRRGAAMLAVLRLTALAALGWVLAGPSVMEPAGTGERAPRVTMLFDTSASMAERDVMPADASVNEPVSRWQAIAADWLEPAFLDGLRRRATLELRGFDESARDLDAEEARSLTPDGEATHLFSALEHVTRERAEGESLDVLVALSDGRDTRDAFDERLAATLAERGTRVFGVPVGRPRRGPHLALQAWPEADVLHEGQSTTIHASVTHHRHAGRAARLVLYRNGERVDQQRVSFDESRVTERVRFEVTPPGPGPRSVVTHEYALRVEPMSSGAGGDDASEFFVANDASAGRDPASDHVFIQVSRERIRVALLEGQPYWDTRFLGRLLQRDPRVELTAWHALGDQRRLHVAEAEGERLDSTPMDQATLNRFDVVILGGRIERFFPGDRARLLREYVEAHGGALVLARGRPFDTETEAGREAMAGLEPIAPVTWGERHVAGLRLALTAAGRESPLFSLEGESVEGEADGALLTRWPQMIAATRIDQAKAASVVLLRQAPVDGETEGMAAVVHGRAGRGQVFAVLTDGLWRLALGPPEAEAAQAAYEMFWRRAMRWLAADGEFLPGQDVALTLDRTIAEPEEPVRATVAARHVPCDLEPELTLMDPDGDAQRVTLEREDESATRWHGTLHPAQPGIHRLQLRLPEAPELIPPETPIVGHLAVRRRSIERLDTAARPQTLQSLAEATGGEVLALDERDRLLAHLDAIEEAREGDRQPRYVFARWPAFFMIALCLGLEWLLRRRSGSI